MASYRSVSISEFIPGSVLMTPVFDEHLVKLLDAGAVVDQNLIDRLQVLGITELVVESTPESIVKRPKAPLPVGVRVQKIAVAALPVERCSVCGMIIALQPPMPNSKASTWLCKSCGAVYFGTEEGGLESHGVSRTEPTTANPFIVPVALKVDASVPAVPPENLQRLVKALASEGHKGAERRRHKRYPIMVPVVALSLTSDFRIDGEPVQMTTANVSLGGAALIHTRFVEAPYLALDFTVAGIELLQVVLKVLRVRSLGLVYEVGGEFISRLTHEPN